jgi:antitoxin (DNA-binding transcriptional repressor) of toxin-antitoxin stability system
MLAPGEEVAITENNRTVAKLIAPLVEKPRPIPGRGKGALTINAEDDEHLEDFKEYIP